MFDAQAEIKSEVLSGFPIILEKVAEVVGAVLVVEDAAATEAANRRSGQKFLKIGLRAAGRGCGIGKKQLTIENLREELVEVDASVLTAKAKNVGTLHPAHSIDKVVVVL